MAEAALLRDRYERMRSEVLARSPSGAETQLVAQQGMWSWMHACLSTDESPPSVSDTSCHATVSKPMVEVLASLVIGLAERTVYGHHR